MESKKGRRVKKERRVRKGVMESKDGRRVRKEGE